MDADTDVTLLTNLRLARVQTHAHIDLRPLGPRVGGQVALGVDCGSHSIGRGTKSNEEGVALGVNHPTAVCLEDRREDVVVSCQELVVAMLAAEQPGRALDVREQEGDGAGG